MSQLHPFYTNIVGIIDREDRRDVTAALAHVIKHVPIVTPDPSQPNMLKVLEMFCLPIAQRLHEIAAQGKTDNVDTKTLAKETTGNNI